MIKLLNCTKHYRSKKIDYVALQNINLSFPKNSFSMILGPSGCGKTTLLNIIGLMSPLTSGEYYFNNENILKYSAKQLATIRNQKIGFVFQAYNLLNELTALENIMLPMGYAGVKKKERVAKAKKLLIQFGLKDVMLHYPSELSGGQQQRVAIARALANNPELIIADEPTGNLDSKTSIDVMKILKEINQSGCTIIMTTHNKELIKYSDNLIYMKDGEIVYEN